MVGTSNYEAPRLRFESTGMSPSAELFRWLCEQRKIGYDEQPRQSASSAPDPISVVTAEGNAVGIVGALDLIDRKCRRGERVYGETASDQSATRAWIMTLDRELLSNVAPVFFALALPSAEFLQRIAAIDSPQTPFETWQEQVRTSLTQFDAAQATAAIHRVFDQVESRLQASGQLFLSGNAPGTSDIAFAALAALVILPTKFGMALPTLQEVPQGLSDVVTSLRARRAGQLVETIYQQARTTPQPKLPKAEYGPSFSERLLNPTVIRFGVRLLSKIAPRITVGKTLIVSNWQNVTEVLDRDNDFLIAPINAERIKAVSGPFILGMDRSPELVKQREHVYASVRDADRQPLLATLNEETERLLTDAIAAGGKLDVVNGYARLVAARTAAIFFGIHGPTEQDLMRVIRAVFQETFLNQEGNPAVTTLGVAAGQELKSWIAAEMQRREATGESKNDVLGQLLASAGNTDGARWMLAGMIVGAVDTTATVVANIITEVLADPRLKQAMQEDLQDPRLLLGWCWEALRRRPHNIGMLRQAGSNAHLGGTSVPEGTKVLVLTVGAMFDPSVFDNPTQMNPRRPLDRYLHFGRGLHICTGRDLNALQIPVIVRELLRRNVSGPPRVRTRGPFPDELIVTISQPR